MVSISGVHRLLAKGGVLLGVLVLLVDAVLACMFLVAIIASKGIGSPYLGVHDPAVMAVLAAGALAAVLLGLGGVIALEAVGAKTRRWGGLLQVLGASLLATGAGFWLLNSSG